MTLMQWGRGLLLWGLVAAALALAPAIALSVAPPEWSAGFLGLIAIMLSLSVAPLAAFTASAGAILVLVAVLRRGRS